MFATIGFGANMAKSDINPVFVPPCRPKDVVWIEYRDHCEEDRVYTDENKPEIVKNTRMGWIEEWDDCPAIGLNCGTSSTGEIDRMVIMKSDIIGIHPIIKRRKVKPAS